MRTPHPTAKLIADRVRDLSHRKTQAEIASEAGFANANMMTFLKNGRNKVPLDRVPSLAKALGVDPAMLLRLALDQAVGAKTPVAESTLSMWRRGRVHVARRMLSADPSAPRGRNTAL